jgi:hypothetical protein
VPALRATTTITTTAALAAALWSLTAGEAGARAQSSEAPPPPFDEVQVTPPPASIDTPVPGAPEPPPLGAPPAAAELTQKATPPPGQAGWIPSTGFVVRSDDGNYKLRIGLQTGYKFEPVSVDGDFQNRRAFFVLRPIFAGNLFKEWIRYWTSLELASNPPYLLDSYVEVNPIKEVGVRVGQQYTLIGRSEQFGPQQILFPEWAPVAEYFWTGRDKGLTGWGQLYESKLEYYVGLYSGTPLRQFEVVSGNYVVAGRVVWNPLGPTGATEFPYIMEGGSPFRVSASLQGYHGHVQQATENFNPSSFRFDVMPTGDLRTQTSGGADFWIQAPKFMASAEAYVRRTEVTGSPSYTSVGVWGQAGYMVLPRTMDVAVRLNYLNPSLDLGSDLFWSAEGQVAYYVTRSPNLVLKLRYGYGRQQTPGMDALGAVALALPTGTIHIGTAQLNLAF